MPLPWKPHYPLLNTRTRAFNKNDEWETDDDVFGSFDDIYHFYRDVCATKETAKVHRWWTIEQNALKQSPWTGSNWMNCPYRKIDRWAEKCVYETSMGFAWVIVGLLPAWIGEPWFSKWVLPFAQVTMITKRLKFTGYGLNYNAPFASMACVWPKEAAIMPPSAKKTIVWFDDPTPKRKPKPEAKPSNIITLPRPAIIRYNPNMNWMNSIMTGDLFDIVPTLPDRSVDLVATSPPYANQRVDFYPSISEDEYPEWTTRWMQALRPKLVPNANIAIVIRPHVIDGCISDYVLRTRLALRAAGWFEIEELIWIKSTSPPTGHKSRLRRSWESVLWFSNSRRPFTDTKPDTLAKVGWVGIHPTAKLRRLGMISASTARQDLVRLKDYLDENDYIEEDYIKVGVHENAKGNNHTAQYPERLADWIIRILSPENGVVFDPFAGSGTTLVAARRAGRFYIGTEIVPEYADMARQRLNDAFPEYAGQDIFEFLGKEGRATL